MNALITGGFGFIGRHLNSCLTKQGISNLPFGFLTPAPGQKVQDMPDTFFDGFDTIFHLAAIPRVGISLERPGEVLENNHAATLRLLELCRKRPELNLIFASSSSVKFANLTENPYALSKKISEDEISMYRNNFNIKAASVRFFNVYGPGEANYGKHTTLVKACKQAILACEPIKVNGDGQIMRDYTHVNDVVSGLLEVSNEMQAGTYKPLYELGFGEPRSVKQIVETFTEGTNTEVQYGPPRMGDAARTWSDPAHAPEKWFAKIDVLNYIREWKAQGCPND